MGKGDIRTRRGKIWRGTYGVTRPRRYKTAARPAARKVKTLKDLPNAVKNPVAETIQDQVLEGSAEITASGSEGTTAKKAPAKKASGAKKTVTKKNPEKKD